MSSLPNGSSAPTSRPSRSSIAGFVLLFSGIWTFVVMIFNVFLVFTAVRSLQAASFPTVTGVVLSSELDSHLGGEGNRTRMYEARIRYQYQVNGATYTSDRRRFGEISSSDSGSSSAAVERYVPGSMVTVYYDPADPSRAVLETGFDGDTRFMVIFLTPFNAVMVATWVFAAGALLNRPRPRIIDGPVIRVKLDRVPPLLAICGGALAAGFPMIFIFGFVFGGSVSARQLAAHLTVVGAVGLAAGVYFAFRRAAGHYDLLVDPVRRVLTIPPGIYRGQVADRDVPFSKVHDVRIEASTTTQVGNQPLRHVMLDAGGPSIIGAVKLRGFADRTDAERFAAWLRERIGLSAGASEPAPASSH